MNEMGWVEYVNYTKKKAEVEALETTGENVSSGDSPAPSSCLPNPRGVPRVLCVPVHGRGSRVRWCAPASSPSSQLLLLPCSRQLSHSLTSLSGS